MFPYSPHHVRFRLGLLRNGKARQSIPGMAVWEHVQIFSSQKKPGRFSCGDPGRGRMARHPGRGGSAAYGLFPFSLSFLSLNILATLDLGTGLPLRVRWNALHNGTGVFMDLPLRTQIWAQGKWMGRR